MTLRHPGSSFLTNVALVTIFLAFVLSAWSLYDGWNTAREGRIENCRAVNELSRKIFVTAADLGVPTEELLKFKPTTDCEEIP